MNKIRVLIADDHPGFRVGLSRALEDEPDLEVVARPTDGEEAVKLARELRPDIAILDVAMPKVNGIEAAKQIKADCPDVGILMISAYSYDSYVLASLKAGAVGYLLKTIPLPEVVAAVRMVHNGHGVLNLSAAGRILRLLTADTGSDSMGISRLQPREVEVIKLVATGMSNKEIASELGISDRTIQTHLINVFRRLGVGSRTEAVLCALKEGWLTLDDLSSSRASGE